MAWTPGGWKITGRFLRRDERDMKKHRRMLRLYRLGKLDGDERAMRTLWKLGRTMRRRYGHPLSGPLPKARRPDPALTAEVERKIRESWGTIASVMAKLEVLGLPMKIEEGAFSAEMTEQLRQMIQHEREGLAIP